MYDFEPRLRSNPYIKTPPESKAIARVPLARPADSFINTPKSGAASIRDGFHATRSHVPARGVCLLIASFAKTPPAGRQTRTGLTLPPATSGSDNQAAGAAVRARFCKRVGQNGLPADGGGGGCPRLAVPAGQGNVILERPIPVPGRPLDATRWPAARRPARGAAYDPVAVRAPGEVTQWSSHPNSTFGRWTG